MSKKILFNEGWTFTRQPLDTTLEEVNKRRGDFKTVELPHDWLISSTWNLYENGTGWYSKYFQLHKKEGAIYLLRFDGVYMDTVIYVNDIKVGEWKYGYSAFEVDLTAAVKEGENEIKVSVRYESPNSRWYTGAGIYRNVWLKELEESHIVSDGIYISAKETGEEGLNRWQVEIETELVSQEEITLHYVLLHKASGKKISWQDKEGKAVRGEQAVLPSADMQKLAVTLYVQQPQLWDIESPACYELEVSLLRGEELLQQEKVTFGFRTIEFKPDSGFYLNHRHVKLKGVCEHHDLGCLGAAYYEAAMRRKFKTLKAMGANAVRTAHNMPAENVMELADEMGLLIVSESFDMWEHAKTPYDYARFFDEWHAKDVASWVRRDRNHPSIIMWSIGNEIYDTHESSRGQEITRSLMEEVRCHDPRGNAAVTIGSNYMPWENAQKCADIVKLAGYNYGEKYYEQHHKAHPDWVIYGSETASVVQSRGIYHFPLSQPILSDDDEQCSSLGNSTTSWGAKSHEACLIHERDCSYSCGQFIWSGHDYIGEPTPYHTKNSYFGQIDTAGFPKDSYYIYQAEWTSCKEAPMVHLFPYWDFNEGELIDICICSNAPKVELFLDGESQGTFDINHESGKQLVGHWQLPYRKGKLEAIAYDEEGRMIARDVRSSFGEASRITMQTDKNYIRADGRDLVFVEIGMKDDRGNKVENARNRIQVEVTSGGRLLGLDNGDSTDYDEYQGMSKRMFQGRLLAVIAAEKGYRGETIEIKASSPYVICARTVLQVIRDEETAEKSRLEEVPVRKIELRCEGGSKLSKERPQAEIQAKIHPEYANDKKLIWRVVDDAGIPSHLAVLEAEGSRAKVSAVGDGRFRVRCMSKNGGKSISLISQLDFTASGLGRAYLNPYEFISGGVYTYSKGEVGSGNEKGFATARDGRTEVGFRNIDFGPYGSDEITIPVFALSSEPYEIEIWEGMPEEEGSQQVADVIYQKPSIWNTYQEETYRLNKRIKGISSICFVLRQKVHIKGFYFKKYNRAFEKVNAIEADHIYGDQFTIEKDWVKNIGNNVTLVFNQMDFGEEGAGRLLICGLSAIEKNSIHLQFEDETNTQKQLLEYTYSEKEKIISYEIKRVTGVKNVSFIFMPGSQFDFKWFKFEK